MTVLCKDSSEEKAVHNRGEKNKKSDKKFFFVENYKSQQTEQKKLKSIARETIRQPAVLKKYLLPSFLYTSPLTSFRSDLKYLGEPTNREMEGERDY